MRICVAVFTFPLCVCVDVPVENLRLRFALLQSLNNTLESFFLPLVELRQTHTYQNSIAALLCGAKGDTHITITSQHSFVRSKAHSVLYVGH